MAPFSHLVENSVRRRLGVQNRVKSSDKEGRQTFCPSAFPSLQFESHQLVGIDLGISRIPTWRMKFWFALSVCQRGPETSNSWSTLKGKYFFEITGIAEKSNTVWTNQQLLSISGGMITVNGAWWHLNRSNLWRYPHLGVLGLSGSQISQANHHLQAQTQLVKTSE